MAAAWDAFISYARATSQPTAIAVQRGLERFARPWHQRRAVRVFRDDSAMSTNPALWSAIEEGLGAAGHLLVLLSPAARESAWVNKEIGWWLDNKGPDTILLALDDGDLVWDAAAGGFTAASAVPPALRDAFAEEPRWLDLRWLRDSPTPGADPRFAAAMADLSAPLRGVPRDELVGEDLTQHRRVRRLARSAVALLVVLLAVSVVATGLAVQQRDDLSRQAVTLRSRELAAASAGLLDTDLRLAQLLAVRGYRTESSPVTRAALLQASFAAPVIDSMVSFDAEVTALATSADGSTVVVGLAGGQVYTLPADGGAPPALRFTTPARVTALVVSSDGGMVLAGAAGEVVAWDGSAVRRLGGRGDPVPAGGLAVSPSGRRAVVVRAEDAGLISYDTATGRRLGAVRDPFLPPDGEPALYAQYTELVSFLDERTVQLVGNDARWLRLDLESGRTDGSTAVPWRADANLYVASRRGDYLLAAPLSNGQAVTVWPLSGADREPSPLSAGAQLIDPLDLAISPDGGLVLVNDSSTGLSVAPVAREDALPVVPASRIAGLGAVTDMAFLTPTRAVAAGRAGLALLSFGGPGRGAVAGALSPRPVGSVGGYAVDYRNSRLAVSPDGSRLAVLDISGAALQVAPLPGRPGRALPVTSLGEPDSFDDLVGPVWIDDETVLVVGSSPGQPARRLTGGVLRWDVGAPPRDGEGDHETPLAAASASGLVTVALSGGTIQTRAVPGAALVGSVAVGAPGARYHLAAVSADLRHVALVDTGQDADTPLASVPTLRVVDAHSGGVVHEQRWPAGTGIAGIEFAGSTVLVAQVDGSVDVLPDFGRGPAQRIATAGVRTSTGSVQQYPPVVGGTLVGLPTRSGLQLYDLATLQPAGTLQVPPGFEAVPRSYTFAPDGHTLVTGFFGADARTAAFSIRPLDPEAVVAQVCATAGGALSSAQWEQLVGTEPPTPIACG